MNKKFIIIIAVIIVLVGFWVRNNYGFSRIAAGILAGSVLFFLVTNFGVYLEGWYGYGFFGRFISIKNT